MSKNQVLNYGWKSSRGTHSLGYITPEIFKVISQLKAKSVIDIGTGNGALCGSLAALGLHVAGVEYDKTGVDIAKASYPTINFFNIGVQDNPAEILEKEQLFDVAVSTEVVEHLFSPHDLPIFASSLLKTGGHLIVTTPYHGYLKNLMLSIFDRWDQHHTALWHGGHVKFWSRATLSRLLEENGFHVVGFSGVGRVPYLWKSMVLVAQKA